ncbi:MAG: Rrf2 family transcriptional regulator [Candidatus Competibacterales bacterium]
MKLSTKGRYAVTAMMDLAIHDARNQGPMTLAEISQGQGISLSYLEQLFARLRKRGLVAGVRGPGGGYRLARPATEISVADIVVAVDDKANGVVAKAGDDAKDPDQIDITQALWSELSCQILTFLEGITLGEFVQRSQDKTLPLERPQGPGRGAHRRVQRQDGNSKGVVLNDVHTA